MHGQLLPDSALNELLQVKQVVGAVMQLPHLGEHIEHIATLAS
jgi:hypothetical protein